MKLTALLLLCLLMSSCDGQVKSNLKIEQKETVAADPNAYKDPLFFIDGQLCQHLREIYQDHKGQLWFGTNVYGLMVYNGDSLRYITRKEGFVNHGRVTGIIEDKDKNLWIASGAGLSKYDGRSFTLFENEKGWAYNEIWTMIIDSKGTFWIGHTEGLSRFDGLSFENITIPTSQIEAPNTIYSANRIASIIEDQYGNLWLGTDGHGLLKYDGERFERFTTAEGLCDNTIYDLMEDRKGNIWIGTFFGGVAKYDGKTFTNYTKDGLISGVEAGG
ncbi:MAG: two-component regulator propeller domain-containing protein, partial [Bacteroidota bacterium]